MGLQGLLNPFLSKEKKNLINGHIISLIYFALYNLFSLHLLVNDIVFMSSRVEINNTKMQILNFKLIEKGYVLQPTVGM